jgi:hypothetical protein
VYGVLLYKKIDNPGAVFEWGELFSCDRKTPTDLATVIALIFTGYVLSFFIDLLPASRAHHHKRQPREFEMTGANGTTTTDRYKNEYSNGSAAAQQQEPDGALTNGHAQAAFVRPTSAQNF